MDWNELASNELPVITQHSSWSISQTRSQSIQHQEPPTQNSSGPYKHADISTKNVKFNENSSITDDFFYGDAGRNQTSQMQFNEKYRLPTEKIDDLIERHERMMLSSLIHKHNDITRQKTSDAIDAQFQALWSKEKENWINEIVDPSGSSSYPNNRLVGFDKSRNLLGASILHSPVSSSTKSMKPSKSFVEVHWKIVQQIGIQSQDNVIEQFFNVASDAIQHETLSSSMMGYASAWKLVSRLTSASLSPIDQARATLSHFCLQFQETVSHRVRQASLTGQDISSTFVEDGAVQCEIYTRLTTGVSDPWAICYFCLRCGDVVSALEVISKSATNSHLQRFLTILAKFQGNTTCIWDGQGTDLVIDPSEQRAMSYLLETSDGSMNIYKKAVISLLSANSSWPFIFENVEGFKTIEDYLTGLIWIALFQQNSIDKLIKLGSDILKLGPLHFNDQSSFGWSFALPLLASQQYQTALLWLTESGGALGLLQASHIGLALINAGIPVRNIGASDTNGTFSNLIVAYAHELLLEHGSIAALDYLIQIPHKIRSCKEISKLISITCDLDKLVGTLNAEGMRIGGAISNFFNESDLSSILVEASRLLSADNENQQKIGSAVMCLMLAHRYDDVVSMLNFLISPANKTDKNRSFWLGQVSSFHSNYVTKRTHVLDELEHKGKMSLIRTSFLLIDLNTFFDCYRNGDERNECWRIAQKTQLLPSTESNRKIKETEYAELDPLIRDAMPYFLVAVMDILSQDYIRLKKDLLNLNGVVREQLRDLKETARHISSFASFIDISTQHIGTITQLMSIMI